MVAVQDPKIEIYGRRSAANVQLSVQDNGPALSNELFMMMTEPLATTKANGTGLGLAIVRSIVEAHSGKLELYRLSPQGLRATVSFPLFHEKMRAEHAKTPAA